MNAELEILGVKLKHYRVDAAMEIAEEYLSNDKLNTIGIVTMQMLMQASKEPTWKQYIEDLDLTVIGETEVLEAAGIDPETPSYEEVETNEFIARFFWGLIQKKSRIFVLGDTEEELQTLQKYLTETYPGIEIGGGAVVETLEESAFDSLVNEINSQTTDVIVSGLAGTRQDRFVLENSSKIINLPCKIKCFYRKFCRSDTTPAKSLSVFQRSALGAASNDLVGNVLGHRLVVRRLHDILATALRLGTQVGGVAEHLSQRNERVDTLGASHCLHALDLTTASIQVADNIAQILVGNDFAV